MLISLYSVVYRNRNVLLNNIKMTYKWHINDIIKPTLNRNETWHLAFFEQESAYGKMQNSRENLLVSLRETPIQS